MRKTSRYIVVSDVSFPLYAARNGVLYRSSVRVSSFPSRAKAQQAIKRTHDYAFRKGYLSGTDRNPWKARQRILRIDHWQAHQVKPEQKKRKK